MGRTIILFVNKGNFFTWPGLTEELIFKNIPKIPATAKCHAKLAKKYVRSTHPPDPTPDLPVTSDPPLAPDTRTKTIWITVIEPSDLLATDLTGRFTTIYSRGYNYIIVCYIYDTNRIIVRPMKNRSVSEYIRVYQQIFSYLEKRDLRPAVNKMDNECPQAIK